MIKKGADRIRIHQEPFASLSIERNRILLESRFSSHLFENDLSCALPLSLHFVQIKSKFEPLEMAITFTIRVFLLSSSKRIKRHFIVRRKEMCCLSRSHGITSLSPAATTKKTLELM